MGLLAKTPKPWIQLQGEVATDLVNNGYSIPKFIETTSFTFVPKRASAEPSPPP